MRISTGGACSTSTLTWFHSPGTAVWNAGLAARGDYPRPLQRKREVRAADQRHRPLEAYRAEELALMHRDIFDDRRGFTAARHAFVNKQTRSPNGDTRPMPALAQMPPSTSGPAVA